ncbi:MAG: hypothetical protein RL091_1726, partial [Verrucomicrobiota bacterium]
MDHDLADAGIVAETEGQDRVGLGHEAEGGRHGLGQDPPR